MEAHTEKAEGAAVRDVKLIADAVKFATAAEDVSFIAIPKLVNAMVADR